jgi:hypothetical protein
MKKKKRSIFTESSELEEKLKIARKKADADRENSLTMDNATDEVTYTLLMKAMSYLYATHESHARNVSKDGQTSTRSFHSR